jgi:hypothetical protein
VQKTILSGGNGALEGLLDYVFGDNGLAAVRAILWRVGLKIKTHGTLAFIFVCMKSG